MKFNFSLIYCRIQWRIETKGNFGLNWVDFIDFANRWSQLWGFEEHSSSVSGIGSIGGSGSIHVSDCLLRQLLLILQPRRGLLLLVLINSFYLSIYLSFYISLLIYPSIHPSIYLSICLSIYIYPIYLWAVNGYHVF